MKIPTVAILLIGVSLAYQINHIRLKAVPPIHHSVYKFHERPHIQARSIHKNVGHTNVVPPMHRNITNPDPAMTDMLGKNSWKNPASFKGQIFMQGMMMLPFMLPSILSSFISKGKKTENAPNNNNNNNNNNTTSGSN